MSGLTNFMAGYNNFMKTYTDSTSKLSSPSSMTRSVLETEKLMEDPRTADWFLSGKLGHLVVILATYLYFCTSAGPRFMKDKKPFKLKRTIQVYNLFQIFFSIYLVYEALQSGWGTDYSFSCQPVVPGEKGMRMARAVWLYYLCKLIELLDTVFFVLRKKNNQVTFLHIYHHTLMPVCAWIGITFLPGGHGTLMGSINTFVHVIMYSYYFFSSLGPQYQKYLWWKKHLTALQMIQFCIVFYHNFQVLFHPCDYPKFLNGLLASQAAYFLYLFGCFYHQQYVKQKKVRTEEEEKKLQNGAAQNGISNNIVTIGYVNNISNGKINNSADEKVKEH